MVSTRRGVRVCSPNKTKTNSDESVDVQATPSTARRTVSVTTPLDTSASEDESRSLPPGSTEESIPSSQNRPTLKRCTRSSRLHSPQQPCTPAGSVHEGDVSDMESCCSALSDREPPPDSLQRRGRKAQPPRTASQEEEAGSEAESSPSPVSQKRRSRRSTRARKTPEQPPCTSHSDAAEPDASSQMATRSTRRSTRTRASARTPGAGGELSDADSCASGAPEGPASSARATRSARRMPLGQPIPLHLDAASEGSQSPAPRRGGRRRNPASEPPSCDSEGVESGPSTPSRRGTRSRSRSAAGTDSDSDVLETAARRATRLSVVLERVLGSAEEEGPNQDPMEGTEAQSAGDQSQLNESKLEQTLVEDADCTLVEEKTTTAIDEEKDCQDATNADLGSMCDAPERPEASCDAHEGGVAVVEGAVAVVEGAVAPSDTVEAESILEEDLMSSAAPAVTTEDQQREPSQERECDAQPPTQEVPPPTQEVPPPTQEAAPPTQEAAPPTQEAQTQELPPLTQEVLPPTQEATPPAQEVLPSVQAETSEPMEEEVMEVDASDPDSPQTEDSDQVMVLEPEQAQARSIQVNGSQGPKVKVELVSEPPAPQHTDVVVHQKTRVISLLDSSEEEEEEDDEEGDEGSDCEIVEEDGVEHQRAGSSKVPDSAEAGGLFMIDTRPGQDADQQYLKEGGLDPRQEGEDDEDEEDFVDEEGDEDDDEDAQMLSFTRNPKAKELSTSIDPGLRVKELGGLYINFDGSKSKPVSNSLKRPTERSIQDEAMKNSVIGPEFEKQSAAPPYKEAKRRLKLKSREERQKTTGDGWFNMKAPELTPELKADLKLIKMRGSLDPKRFYKKSDREGLPKYFQVGTVMDSPVDFYHSRVPKKDRKRTMVEELMADSDFRKQNKKKYMEIMAEKTAAAQGRSKKRKLQQGRRKQAF